MRSLHPDKLTIRLFGPADVSVNGSALPPLRSRKSLWLLALLALRLGREVQRSWLAETLWPDSLPEQALGSLRQCLADLRRALGDAAGSLEAPSSRTLRIDPAAVWVDVHEFDEIARRKNLEQLPALVELYRGPLLEGCEEPWVVGEREQRQHQYVMALHALGSAAAAAGDFAGAEAWLRQGAAAAPYAQELHRSWMGVLEKQGKLQPALEVYRDLRRQLHEEHHAQPDPETNRLYQQLLSRARQAAATPTGSSPHPVTGTRVAAAAPKPLTSLIGREEALTAVRSRLALHRLVTLTGPGGVGKTRLAQAVAEEAAPDYAAGVCWLDLSLIAWSNLGSAVGRALGLGDTEAGAFENDGARLGVSLRGRQLLLILDNCEGLLPELSRWLAALLAAAPELDVLATSRERLGVTGEVIYRVDPLPSPPDEREVSLDAWPSTRLFRERAESLGVELPPDARVAAPVARICRRLDGLPLAIELAAGLVEVLGVDGLEQRLEDRFRLLESTELTRPERHRSLRVAIEGSYSRLEAPEQRLLRAVSLFEGSWTMDAAAALTSDSVEKGAPEPRLVGLVGRLIARSLVIPQHPPASEESEVRYRLLESIREFCREKLNDSAEGRTTREHRDRYLLETAERGDASLGGRDAAAALRELDAWSPDLHDALEAALRRGDTRFAGHLAASLGRYWRIRGYFREGRRAVERVLELDASGELPAPLLGRLYGWAGFFALYLCDYAEAERLAERSLAIWRDESDPASAAAALGTLAILAKDQGDRIRARELFGQSLDLARAAGDEVGAASALGYLGILAADVGELDAARCHYEAALEARRRCGDLWGVAASRNNLGMLALEQGDFDGAEEQFEQSLHLRRQLMDRRSIAVTLSGLARAAMGRCDLATAQRRLKESLEIVLAIGERRAVAFAVEAFAELALAEGDPERALLLGSAAARLRTEIHTPLSPRDQERFDRCQERARALAGADRAAAAQQRGLGLDLSRIAELLAAG